MHARHNVLACGWGLVRASASMLLFSFCDTTRWTSVGSAPHVSSLHHDCAMRVR